MTAAASQTPLTKIVSTNPARPYEQVAVAPALAVEALREALAAWLRTRSSRA
jgi:hypothetical protein